MPPPGACARRNSATVRSTALASMRPSRFESCAAITVPARDRLAVQPAAVAEAGFDRVAERVPEVEECALAALLALVRADHLALLRHERSIA